MPYVAPRTWVTGEVVTAAQLNQDVRDNISFLAASTLGYAEVTADQTGIGSAMTDLTGLAVTFTAVAGRYYLITARTQWTNAGSVNASISLHLREGTTTLETLAVESMANAWTASVHSSARRTFTAGSHTVKLSSTHDTGGTFTLSAATVKAFILVEDIGAV